LTDWRPSVTTPGLSTPAPALGARAGLGARCVAAKDGARRAGSHPPVDSTPRDTTLAKQLGFSN
jgi:hypothetical protein